MSKNRLWYAFAEYASVAAVIVSLLGGGVNLC